MAEAVELNEFLENVGFGWGRRLLIIRGKAERTKRPSLQGLKADSGDLRTISATPGRPREPESLA